ADGEQGARAGLYRIGPQRYVGRVLLAWARAEAQASDGAWHELAALPERWMAPLFPLKAADFMAQGLEKGPALGAALRAAEEAWIAQDFPADTEALAQIVATALAARAEPD